jgi:CRP-like cAMP-binding protein
LALKHILKKILQAPQLKEGVAWSRRHFAPNDVVVQKGDVGKTLFIVESGKLQVAGTVELENKSIKSGLCEFGPGSVFGEMCLHHTQLRMATVTAMTDAELLEIDGQKLSIYLDDHPIDGYLFYKALFEVITSRLDIANQRIENLMAWGLKVHEIEKFL